MCQARNGEYDSISRFLTTFFELVVDQFDSLSFEVEDIRA